MARSWLAASMPPITEQETRRPQVTSETTRQASMQQRATLLALNQFVEYCAGAEEEKWYKYVCRIVEKPTTDDHQGSILTDNWMSKCRLIISWRLHMLLFEVFLFALFCFENIPSSLILRPLCGFLMLKLVTLCGSFLMVLSTGFPLNGQSHFGL